jgi:hypothetical protein
VRHGLRDALTSSLGLWWDDRHFSGLCGLFGLELRGDHGLFRCKEWMERKREKGEGRERRGGGYQRNEARGVRSARASGGVDTVNE